MDLSIIYQPITKDLSQFESELLSIAQSCSGKHSQKIIQEFFAAKGKYLRPALIILSSRASVPEPLSPHKEMQVIKLAAAAELMHSASLIHDDVIDQDLLRRGHKTLNNSFGDKLAVLAGDLLFSKAFFLVSNYLPSLFTQEMSRLTETMCSAEIEQAGDTGKVDTKEGYLRVIQGKTASFMSLCCKLGSLVADEQGAAAPLLREFGLNFGLVYQILDDQADDDPIAAQFKDRVDAQEYAEKAIDAIKDLPASVYKTSLTDLLAFIMSKAHQ